MVARAFWTFTIVLALMAMAASQAAAQSTDANGDGLPWRFVDVIITPESPTAGSIASVQFSIQDQDGAPVSGLRATAVLRAPSTAEDTEPPTPVLSAVGRELGDPGRYDVSVALNRSGRWWIEIRVEGQNGELARYDHFAVVDGVEEPQSDVVAEPLFLRGDDWRSFFRLDTETGSVVSLAGEELFSVGETWWIGSTSLDPRGSVSSQYGGTWRLTFEFGDGLTGERVQSITVGDIRANLHAGSSREPAIATAMEVSPDGEAIYLYWARQLGQGWVATLAVVDPLTGEIEHERLINGAVGSTGFWAEMSLLENGQLAISEQVVQQASVRGYRLSLFDRATLDLLAQYRRTNANQDPLTHCMLTYPGPVGSVNAGIESRFSLCTPPNDGSELALVVWSPLTGEEIHSIDLTLIAGEYSAFADGVASPDGRSFYAVNTRTLRVAEVDMVEGAVVREADLLPDDADPSTLDRFFDWFFGAWTPPAAASGSVEPAVTINQSGDTLYIISQPESREPGILVVDLQNLEVVNSLLTGQRIDGLISTSDGRIAVIERGEGEDGDRVTILDDQGDRHLSVLLPGRSDVVGSRR